MKKVIAYVHTHWDREWYRDFEDFRLRLIEVFNEILDALEKNELPCFYFDGQTAALEDYLEIFPQKITLIKKLIKNKKLRIGPFYCSSDSFLISGESFYKNLEIGLKKSKELGETEFIGYLSDTFGHSQSIPYILKSFGIDKACLWRGLGDLPADIDWNGIQVTYLIQGYFQDFLNTNLTIEEKAELLKKYIDKISLKSSDNILLPIGADHLAIAKDLQKQVNQLNNIYKDYQIDIKTPFEYFNKIKNRAKFNGEFLNNKQNFILSGVYSSRIYIKQANAKSQWLLNKISEPLQALGHFYFKTHNKQNEIDYAYKTLIKNHAHDSIYGCSIDIVHDEMITRFNKIDSVSKGIIKRTLRDINGKYPAVINLSNNEYSGPIYVKTNKKLPKWMNAVKINSYKGFSDEKLYNINEIPITEDYTTINEYIIDVNNLKPFSLTRITKDNINNEININTTENSIENKNIKMEISNNEIILTDKIKNKQYKNFITITDRADIGDSYNFGALEKDKPIYAVLKSFKVGKSNKQFALIKLTFEIKIPKESAQKGRSKKSDKCLININAVLYNQAEYIIFKTNWINKSKNHILQIGFNLQDKIYETINEDLYGIVKRKFNPDFNIYEQIPAKKGIEIKPNTSPMQRFMSAEDFALITKGLTEYEIYKNTVNLTLLRATGIISNPHNPTRGTPAGPPLNTEKLQCIGNNYAEFAISFNTNEKDLYKIADEFYCANIFLYTEKTNTNFIEVKNRNIYISSIKTAEKGIEVRLFNNSDSEEITDIEVNHKEIESIKLNSKEIKNILISK